MALFASACTEPLAQASERADYSECETAVARSIAVQRTLEISMPDDWRVQYHCGENPYGGVATLQTRQVDIWPEVHYTDEQIAHTLYHELAHAWDFATFTPEVEAQWYRFRSLEGGWLEGDPPPTEDFAESLAVCFHGDAGQLRYDTEPPTEEQCNWIKDLAEEW
jgi:hypothetical protein